MELRQIVDRIWVLEDRFPLERGFLPFSIPSWLGQCSTRMTVVQLVGQGVLLHSPGRVTPGRVEEVRALGEVRFIVAPNVMHNSFVLDWSRAFPEAEVVVPPRVSKRNAALAGYRELDATPLVADLDQILMVGHQNHETLFLHRATKTLIATDLAYGDPKHADVLEQIFLRVAGVHPPIGVTSYSRKKVYDLKLFRENLERVAAWDFDRVLMCHGLLVLQGGKKAFLGAWSRELGLKA